MIISHEHKFLFLAPVKVGTTSIRSCLKQYSSIDLSKFYDDPSSFYYQQWHINTKNTKKHFDEQNWNWTDYFKFSFVRNPWDRVVSWYKYQIKWVKKYEMGLGGNTVYYNRYKKVSKLSFREWLENIENMILEDFYDFFICNSNNICLDYIGRFENLQEDFDKICDKIKIPRQQLPHKNKTKHKHYTEYYDEETKQIVAEVFAKDIEHFNYKFGE
jgi:hypothetical protein